MSSPTVDEKSLLLPRPIHQQRHHGKAPALVLSLTVATLVCSVVFLLSLPRLGTETGPGELKWTDIKPSKGLEWHRCYNDLVECARLDVPMDWLDPSEDQRVILAVARIRATDRSDYRGPVIFNPGGPGGSGIWALNHHGKLLQTIVGENHDIISFDPRGIGASTPRIQCWDSIQKKNLWDLQEFGIVDSHPGVLYDAFARASAFSKACERALNSTDILRHISTTSVARDMLEILNQLGEEKLKYWGFSYGTVLGGTFAAMYPEKISRLVSDGNVDYLEWYKTVHINFLRDADRVMESFYEFCHQAGPSRCAFYAPRPSEIHDRLDTLLATLRKNPVIVPESDTGPEMPELVTYSKLKRLMTSILYQPQSTFQRFAEIILALEKEDGRPYYNYLNNNSDPLSLLCEAETIPPNTPLTNLVEGTGDAFPAVLCADGEPLTGTAQDFEDYVKELDEISTVAGAVNVLFRIQCAGRQIRPKWRFAGPFKAETSHPILFIANKADNVTPLISARNNSAGFPGSVILVQNSYGHTTLSAASTCTARHIRSYFQNGTLPRPDSTCEPDSLPFGLPAPEGAMYAPDSELSWATAELSRLVHW